MLLKQGTLLGNRYEVIDRIGAGGMAIVYRAKDIKLERYVTVKVLREEFVTDEEFVSRFKTEAQAAGSLSHSNIVNVYDVGEDIDIYYIVMEYIDGDTLKDLITSKAPFDSQTTISIALQISQALMHAHKNKLIHRDIKPQNIMVRKDGAIKVTDFGIARAATSKTVATTGSAIGSVHYFSPEQARGGYVDEKSDIYSLGIVMFEMVTGRLPFVGDNAVTVAIKQIKEEIPQINMLTPDISLSLQRIIEKAVAKRPEERYADIEQMHSDLKTALIDRSGDFIKKIDIVSSPTVQMTQAQMDQIKNDKVYDDTGSFTKHSYSKSTEDNEDEDEDVDGKSEWKIILAAIITSVLIIGIITVIGFRFISANKNKEAVKSYTMRNLIGREFSNAQELADSLSITLIKIGEKNSDLYEEGRIISQSVEEGEIIKEGDIVEIELSLGSPNIKIPNVMNMEESKALDEFALLDLELEISYEFNEAYPIGVVISQQPRANFEVEAGSKVKLIVSQGQERSLVAVPNVIGDTESEAKNKLTDANLVCGQITYTESETVKKGCVVQQTIAPDTEVEIRSIINLVISSGQPAAPPPEQNQEEQPPEEEAPAVTEPTVPTTPTSQTKRVRIEKTDIPSDISEGGSVKVKILKITSDEMWSTSVYEKERNASDFPIELDIPITEKCELQLYIDDILKWRETVNVGE